MLGREPQAGSPRAPRVSHSGAGGCAKGASPPLTHQWMPHSVLSWPAQRPERGSVGSLGSWVQGMQPIER
jgi:hypothetical protein